MPFTPWPIYDMRSGLQLDKEPWMIPTEAFTITDNCYFDRGRVYKRKGYEAFATGTPLWDIDFDVGANEPAVGDLLTSTTETAGAVFVSVTISGGAWATNDAVGTMRVSKATAPAYANNESLTNFTQSNTVADADGTASQIGFNALPTPPVMLLATHHKSTGISENVACDTDYFFTYDETNGVWIGQGGLSTATPDFAGDDENIFRAENWKDVLFVTNNVDNIHYWNGTTLTALNPSINGTTLDACLLLVAHKSRLVALNTDEGGTRYPQRARCSNVGSYTTWTNDVSVDADTGDFIQNAAFVRGELMVFFERSVWWLRYTGDATTPFSWVQIASTRGSFSPHSAISFEEEVIVLGATTFIASDGLQVYDVATQIPDLVLDMNPNKLGYSFGFVAKEWRQYLCSYPSLTSDYPDKVACLNYVDRAWSLFTMAMHVAGQYTRASDLTYDDITDSYDEMSRRYDDRTSRAGYPTLLIGDRSGNVRKLYTVDNDAGVAIASKLKTKRLTPFEDQKCELGWLDIVGNAGTEKEITVKFYKDNSDIAYKTYTLAMSDAQGREKARWRIKVGEKAKRSHTIEISDNAANNPWAIDAIIPYFREAGRL